MNRTQATLTQAHSDLVDFARTFRLGYGLSVQDAEDLVAAAYEKAHARLVSVKVHKDRNAAIRDLARSEIINALNCRNNSSERVIGEALRIDQPAEDDGTIEIADDREFDPYGDEVPEWMQMTRDTVRKLRRDERKVVTQLKKPGMSYAMARHEIGLTRPKFYTILKKLKLRFRQCFQAYHQCLAEEFAARFHFPLVYISRDNDV